MINIPTVSVIIPAFNEERYLARAIRSVLANSLKRDDVEIIVIDDASTDKTLDTIKQYDSEIKTIVNDENMGLPACLNIGIKTARGRFIVRVDGDDYVHRDYLYILSKFLELNNDLDAVACDYQLVDSRQTLIKTVSCDEIPIGCGIMYRADQLVSIGLYDERFRLNEDVDLRIRFLKQYSIYRVPLALYKYRQHEKNTSKDLEQMREYDSLLNLKHKIN